LVGEHQPLQQKLEKANSLLYFHFLISFSKIIHFFFLVNKICSGNLRYVLRCGLDALTNNRLLAMFGKAREATLALGD
jgi:hypothetical protein